MSLEDDLDALYGVPPEEFTALRKELATAAKDRGDGDAARVIAAARRPTTAAWVVNELIRADPTAKVSLADLTAQLRAAHAAMDGARIRELSTAQRKLVSQLARTGFAAAGMSDPSAAIREDVTGTLQAAIADPEVAAQLVGCRRRRSGRVSVTSVPRRRSAPHAGRPRPRRNSGSTVAPSRSGVAR